MDFYSFWNLLEGVLPYDVVEKRRDRVEYEFLTHSGMGVRVTAFSFEVPLSGGAEMVKVDFETWGSDRDREDIQTARDAYETVAAIVVEINRRSRPAGFWFDSYDDRRAGIVNRLVSRLAPGWDVYRSGTLVVVYNPRHRAAEEVRNYLRHAGVSAHSDHY